MYLTLADIARNPSRITYSLSVGGQNMLLRPLEASDVKGLALFLNDLSPETRVFCTYDGYDLATAQSFCDAINRYDKLRLVIEPPSHNHVVGLMEFSFDIPESDHIRFDPYQVTLNEHDCRFGPCLADEYQGTGLGSVVLPYMLDIARQFGRKRVILWGGVLAENRRAIRYYEKNGFKVLGVFQNDEGIECLDMIIEL